MKNVIVKPFRSFDVHIAKKCYVFAASTLGMTLPPVRTSMMNVYIVVYIWLVAALSLPAIGSRRKICLDKEAIACSNRTDEPHGTDSRTVIAIHSQILDCLIYTCMCMSMRVCVGVIMLICILYKSVCPYTCIIIYNMYNYAYLYFYMYVLENTDE